MKALLKALLTAFLIGVLVGLWIAYFAFVSPVSERLIQQDKPEAVLAIPG